MTSAPPQQVVLRPGGHGHVLIAQQACAGRETVVTAMLIRPPRGGPWLRLRIPAAPVLGYCHGRQAWAVASNHIAETPVEPTLRRVYWANPPWARQRTRHRVGVPRCRADQLAGRYVPGQGGGVQWYGYWTIWNRSGRVCMAVTA